MGQNRRFRFALRDIHYDLKEKSKLSKESDNYLNQSIEAPVSDTGVRYWIRNLISNQIAKFSFHLSSNFDKASENSSTFDSLLKNLFEWYKFLRPVFFLGARIASSRIVYIPILVVLLAPGILIVLLVLSAMFGVSSVAIGLFTITSVATFVGFTFIVVPGLMLAAITGASAYLVYTITGANQSNNPKFEVLQQELTEKLRGATKKKSNNGIYEVLDQTGETNIGNEDDEDNLSGSVVRSSDVVDDEDVSPSPLIA